MFITPQTARKPQTARWIRDLAADWKRWSVAERAGAMIMMSLLTGATSYFYMIQIFHA